eukprot:12420427-Karenia_brevis.AAC.1
MGHEIREGMATKQGMATMLCLGPGDQAEKDMEERSMDFRALTDLSLRSKGPGNEGQRGGLFGLQTGRNNKEAFGQKGPKDQVWKDLEEGPRDFKKGMHQAAEQDHAIF